MISYTMVIMVILGYDFQKNPVSVSVTSVPGFTTEQACINASKKVKSNSVNGFRWSRREITTTCVANTI